jgi:dolichyl-diphosphooligosaccharide--protein glycosyltransferase
MAGSDSSNKTPSTAIWLGLFFVAALALRIAFGVGTGFDHASHREIFTGNDPYYHDRALRHLLDTGQNLNHDSAINYPEGRSNPNPPLFIWTTAPLAVALQATGAQDPTGTALNVMTGLWGALAIFPVYMIARDLWGRNAALWASLFTAVSGPHIQRSIWGYADHDAITMFLITLAFAFMVKAFRALNVREYVATWKTSAARNAGLKAVFASNRTAFLWSALAGAALTATALVWKGYPYALAVMAVAVGFQLLADHLRNRDATPTFLLYLLPLAMVVLLPWLLYYRMFPEFLDGTVYPSLYVLVGVLVAGLVLVPTREIPSIVVFPALLVAGLVGLALLLWVFPAAGYQVFSGLGYFNQSKLYTTIAEAQRAQLGFVAASFGFFTFLFGFFGFWQSLRGAWKGEPGFMLVAAWGIVAFFMAFAASRFVMNAVPVFAIFIGVFMAWLFAKLGFASRGAASYGQRAERTWGKWTLAVVAALFLVLPNVWMGVDAALSSEYEREHNLSGHWFGAFGISFDLKDNGWLATEADLATRDTGVPLEERPAVIAWWDYGHWNVGIGQHPTVADPFQSHYELAGRFLASESEAEAQSWLVILLADYDYWNDGAGYSPAVASALDGASPGLSSALDPHQGYDEQYKALSAHANGTAVFPLYDHLTEATGKKVGYMAADIRMYPFGATSSGIFYAPAYLANKNPDDFLTTQIRSGSTTLTVHQYTVDPVTGDSHRLKEPEYIDASGAKWVARNGYAYRPGQTPLDGYPVTSGIALFQGQQLIPTQRFSSSMYARAYGSYDASQPAGQGLSHWRVVQQSVGSYFSLPNARESVLLEYYTGASVSGRVLDQGGAPMAGVQVTFQDGTGAYHGFATTDADGRYEVVAPFSDSNDLRLTVLSGGQAIYNTTEVQVARGDTAPRTGVDLHVPFASLSGVVYQDRDGDGAYTAGNDTALPGVQVSAGGRTATSGADGHYSFDAVRAGSLAVSASAEGYNNATQSTVAKSGEAATLDLAMTVKSSTVTLRFLDNGKPVGQVPMALSGPSTRTVTTNPQGNATAILQPGDYHVHVDYNVTVNGTAQRYLADQDFTVAPGGAPMTVAVARQQ